MRVEKVKHAVGWSTDGHGRSLRTIVPPVVACTGREKGPRQSRALLDEYVTCKRCLSVLRAKGLR